MYEFGNDGRAQDVTGRRTPRPSLPAPLLPVAEPGVDERAEAERSTVGFLASRYAELHREAPDGPACGGPLHERYTEPMLLDLIVSKNLARRQLNAGQRALMALEYERFYSEAVKVGRPIGDISPTTQSEKTVADLPQSMSTDGSESQQDVAGSIWVEPHASHRQKSRDHAAKIVGASGRTVQQAKAVQRDAPDLADRVRNGELALDAADKERRARVAALPRPEPAPKQAPVMLTLRTNTGEEVPYPKPTGKATFNESKGAGISWAAWSWNPVTGCLHGCDYCYARAIATDQRYAAAYPAGFTPLFHHQRLDAPANTTIPAAYRDDHHAACADGECKVCAYRRVFVCSMADLYGRWVPDEWINKVHESMCANPAWQYITLTKFPARYVGLDMPPGAWVGTSVDEQKRVRIAEDAFRKIDGVAVKWLSLEPLREPLEFTDLSVFDWVVIGAQTETRQPDGPVPAFAPPFEWVARIVVQALDAGCRVHLKPNMAGRPGMQMLDQYPISRPHGADR